MNTQQGKEMTFYQNKYIWFGYAWKPEARKVVWFRYFKKTGLAFNIFGLAMLVTFIPVKACNA